MELKEEMVIPDTPNIWSWSLSTQSWSYKIDVKQIQGFILTKQKVTLKTSGQRPRHRHGSDKLPTYQPGGRI